MPCCAEFLFIEKTFCPDVFSIISCLSAPLFWRIPYQSLSACISFLSLADSLLQRESDHAHVPQPQIPSPSKRRRSCHGTAIMPGKRFSVVKSEARGAVVKAPRLQSGGNASLVAVARPWGQAFWAFEGSGVQIWQYMTLIHGCTKKTCKLHLAVALSLKLRVSL